MRDVLNINGAELYADGQTIRYNLPTIGERKREWGPRRVVFGMAYPIDGPGMEDSVKESTQKLEARAKAISALPELLELAEFVAERLEASGGWVLGTLDEALCKATTALEKAGAI